MLKPIIPCTGLYYLPEMKLFWLGETISILRPVLKVSPFCIDHCMYWLNKIKLMTLCFVIRFNDKITQENDKTIKAIIEFFYISMHLLQACSRFSFSYLKSYDLASWYSSYTYVKGAILKSLSKLLLII